MKITKAIALEARGGYYNEDLEAIRAGATRDGYFFDSPPQASGFTSIRQPSEAFSIVLLLDNGAVVAGDGMSVEYSAAGGRGGRFRAAKQLPFVYEVCDYLEGQVIGDFGVMCGDLQAQEFDGELHRAAAFYGASQALLQAVALAESKTPAEVVAAYFGVNMSEEMIPINVQCKRRLRVLRSTSGLGSSRSDFSRARIKVSIGVRDQESPSMASDGECSRGRIDQSSCFAASPFAFLPTGERVSGSESATRVETLSKIQIGRTVRVLAGMSDIAFHCRVDSRNRLNTPPLD